MSQSLSSRIARFCVGATIALAVVAPPLGAQADRWVEVGGGNNVTVFADRLSIRREGARVRVWTKWHFATTRAIEFFPDKKYRSEKALYVYHCTDRTSAALQTIYYAGADAGGEVVESEYVSESRAQFTELVPETIGEAILTFVCHPSIKKRR